MIITTVNGISNNGDFIEALNDAIDKVLPSSGSTIASWKLNSVSGSRGGFVNANKIVVVLDISIP